MAQKKPLLATYLIIGDDELKRKDMLRAMEKRISELGELELNMNVFSAADCEAPEDILSACQTIPFLSEKRLVVVKAIESARKPLLDALKGYVESPCDSTVLIIEGEKLAKNLGLFKAIEKSAEAMLIGCEAKGVRDGLDKLVSKLAQKHGCQLSAFDANHLIELVGTSTISLDTEIKKLSDYALSQNSNSITGAMIDELVVRAELPKPWDVADAMSARNARKVAELLTQIPEDSYFATMNMCSSRIRELIIVKSTNEFSRGEKSLGQILGGPDWKYKNHVRWAASFTSDELTRAYIAAADTEQAMKSGTEPIEALQTWLLGICAK